MATHAAERVTEFPLDKVGDGFLTVVIVKPDVFEVSYLDDDFEKGCSWETFSEMETILISVTREAGRGLLGFIENCRKLVHGESAR